MTIPQCGGCRATHWTATYHSQNERQWAISHSEDQPVLVHEDEDFGLWSDVRCAECGNPADASVNALVLDALAGNNP